MSQEKKNERSFFIDTFFEPQYGKSMKILVCVKQVPESEIPIHISDSADWIQEDAITEFKMNRLDEYALEEAILIKESIADTWVDVITVGPARCEEVVKRAIGMGANFGIHILTESEGYQSPSEIAVWMADFARARNYSLILTGAMSEDSMQGQVGPMLAARLARVPIVPAGIRGTIDAWPKGGRLRPARVSIGFDAPVPAGAADATELVHDRVLELVGDGRDPRTS